MIDTSNPRPGLSKREWLGVPAFALAASLAAIVWSWRHGALLNYGDAVAHLHIARRVFDCHQPRLTQLGSVWLPLPHILMIPFVQVYAWWANGIAGVIPSALAYLAACVGTYRLVRRWLEPAAATVALAFFALNPNLLYLQTTAMTEPLFVCEMVWTAFWLVEWRESLESDAARAGRLQALIAAVLVAAIYTRYDGWIMALIAWTSMGVVLARRGGLRSRSFWLASAFVVAAPLAWFVYNAAAFGDWLDFIRGPYSAKAIEVRTSIPGYPPHPGWHNPWVALIFYGKAAELDAAAAPWGNLLVWSSLVGLGWGWVTARRRSFGWALILGLPLPFYAYSVAWGSVPIFLPVWWPFSWYNSRYGMELLPLLALVLGFAAHMVLAGVGEFKPAWRKYAAAGLLALVAVNAGRMLHERALVYVEGTRNIEARRAYDGAIPAVLKAQLAEHPGVLLMDTSVYPELVALTGITLRQTINESDLEVYKDALQHPAERASLVLAFDGDDIGQAVKAHPAGLAAVARFAAQGQPPATLYVCGTLVARLSTGRRSR